MTQEMTQEDKELLIKDLCARLPYDVAIQYGNYHKCIVVEGINTDAGLVNSVYPIEGCKPFLLPISSMTEEQVKEHCNTFNDEWIDVILKSRNKPFNETLVLYKTIDWLNAHHFDYRGLIEKGLAIDATNLNIY